MVETWAVASRARSVLLNGTSFFFTPAQYVRLFHPLARISPTAFCSLNL
jgi:hypothetical protein